MSEITIIRDKEVFKPTLNLRYSPCRYRDLQQMFVGTVSKKEVWVSIPVGSHYNEINAKDLIKKI